MLETETRQDLSLSETDPSPELHSPNKMQKWIFQIYGQITADRPVLAWAMLLPIVLYSVELANFTLSTDEEVPERGQPDDWIRQGRWGMGALTWIMPPIQELPIIATVIFCLCMSISALLITSLISKTRFESIIFIAFFVANPVWPHVAEFSTLSWGLGFALVAVALCAHILKSDSYPLLILGACLLAFAMGVYQSTIFMFVPIALVVCLPNQIFMQIPPTAALNTSRVLMRVIGTVIGATVAYTLITKISLALTHEQLDYVAGYNNVGLFLDPATQNSAARAVGRMLMRLGTGITTGFLGNGYLYLILPWLGALLVPALQFFAPRTTNRDRLSGLIVLAGILGCTLFPILLAGGEVPIRVLLGFPISCALAALAATRRLQQFRVSIIAMTVVALLTSWWITTALFTADQIARSRDAAMATQIMTRMQGMGVGSTNEDEPFVVVGHWKTEAGGIARVSEFFGSSFFGVEDGNSGRIANILWLQGQTGLTAAPDSRLNTSEDAVYRLPVWPAAGSVARIDGVVVLKLGLQPFPTPAATESNAE